MSCIIWFSTLLLAIASVDSLPDPPAVSPPTVGRISLLREAGAEIHGRRLNLDLSVSLLLQVRWIAFTSGHEPNLAKDPTVLTRLAADPSPPTV
jgi:hypothetical protein